MSAQEEQDRIAEISTRAKQAAPGPWSHEHGVARQKYGFRVYDARFHGVCKPTGQSDLVDESNSEFIKHAREDVPWLVSWVTRLTQENEQAAQAAQAIVRTLVPLISEAAIVGRSYGWPEVLAIANVTAESLTAASHNNEQIARDNDELRQENEQLRRDAESGRTPFNLTEVGDGLVKRISELAQENERLKAVGWQPIETAPKDRGFVAAYNADRGVYGMVCWWPGGGWNGEGCWGWLGENIEWSRQKGNQPTHWVLLPAPPSVE